MIVQLAELHRVHPQLASHLHLGVGEVIALSRVDPPLHLLVRLSFLRHAIRLASIYFIGGKGRPGSSSSSSDGSSAMPNTSWTASTMSSSSDSMRRLRTSLASCGRMLGTAPIAARSRGLGVLRE